MGLDVTFPLKELLDNIDVETRVDVIDYRDVGDDTQHLQMLLRIPGMPVEGGMKVWVQMYTFTGADGDLYASVRANPWGRVYKPLTDFLSNHEIEWREG